MLKDPGETRCALYFLLTPGSPPPAHPAEIAPETGLPCGGATRNSLPVAVPTLWRQPTAPGTTLAKDCLSIPSPCRSWLREPVGCNCEHQGQGEEALARDRPGFESQLGCDFEQIT